MIRMERERPDAPDRSIVPGWPALTFAVLTAASVASFFVARALDQRRVDAVFEDQNRAFADLFVRTINDHAQSLSRMANRWRVQRPTPEGLWRSDARLYHQQLLGIAAVGYGDSATVTRMVEPPGMAPSAVGYRMNSEARRAEALAEAARTSRATMTRAIEVRQGGRGFLVFAPIPSDAGPPAYVYGVFRFRELVAALEREAGVELTEGADVLTSHEPANVGLSDHWTRPREMDLLGVTWTVRRRPAADVYRAARGFAPHWVLGCTMLLSLLGSLLVHLNRRARRSGAYAEQLLGWRNAIIEGSPLAIISTNPGGVVRTFNAAAEALLGYAAAEVIGRVRWDVWLDPEEFRRVKRHLADADERFACTVLTKSGGRRQVNLSLRPVRGEDGLVTGYVAMAEDVTEALKQSEELKGALKRAEVATVAKSQFLANISHEIRTPINGVLGMAGLLATTALSAEQRSYAAAIQSSAENLLVLVNDVLDLSKIEAGKLELENVVFAPREVIAGVESTLGFTARQKGLHFRVAVPADLPAWVTGDPTRVRQVLLNLVGNAIKFTTTGQVALSVRSARAGEHGVRLRFEVVDTGEGISSEGRARLFQAFEQADGSTARRFGGTGLGLSICKQLVDLMNGSIGVMSEVGAGSTFWFEVPLTLAAEPGRADAGEGAVPSRRLRILVAEDNQINQVVAKSMLAKLGHRVDVAGNGREALQALRSAPYHVVLMDCQMPEMDGYEATRQIRALGDQKLAAIPIIAMTANAMVGDRETCLAAGMNDYVTKPIRIEQVAAVLARYA